MIIRGCMFDFFQGMDRERRTKMEKGKEEREEEVGEEEKKREKEKVSRKKRRAEIVL